MTTTGTSFVNNMHGGKIRDENNAGGKVTKLYFSLSNN